MKLLALLTLAAATFLLSGCYTPDFTSSVSEPRKPPAELHNIETGGSFSVGYGVGS